MNKWKFWQTIKISHFTLIKVAQEKTYDEDLEIDIILLTLLHT